MWLCSMRRSCNIRFVCVVGVRATRFIPFGMAGRKKVGDYLTDQKVPIVERKRQFVLVSGEDIVWIVGRRTDERFRVGNNTENVLKITKYSI